MSGAGKAFVEARGIHVSYDGNPILERVHMSVERGAFVTIVGASGCGKSTFLRLLLGQETPQKGEILVDGKQIAAEPDPDRGVVFQKYSVFPHLTVWQNLLLPAEIGGSPFLARLFGAARRHAEAAAEAMLVEIGLGHARNRYPAQLSGGMQQRLAIGQALLKKPRILLLDEPFGALDPGIRADMHVLITELWRSCGMTVFMVTHDIQEAFKLGTRILVFDKVRHDPHARERFGATITYDLPLDHKAKTAAALPPDLLKTQSHQGVAVHA
jgi:NitT/TauT family transport system ATP-binding protein